jgi:hypothetical protein
VADEREFQEKIRRLGTLVGELEQVPGNGSEKARELVQLLMQVHGTGLERMMEIVYETGLPGELLIGKLGQDSIVGSLLLLYSLHPDDLESRIQRAVEAAGARLRRFDAEVQLISVQNGVIQLSLHTSGHACGSTTKNLKAIVEESIYDQAPDLTSISILVPEEEAASGFVPIGNLLSTRATMRDVKDRVEVGGAD